MIKVATPILYESALDELNRVRPLLLGDRGRLSLDLPVLCKNPVGTDRPAIGKLARCDEQGALLRNTGNSFKHFQVMGAILEDGDETSFWDFAQEVFAVLVKIVAFYEECELYLVSENDTVLKIFYPMNVCHFIPFKGKRLYFRARGSGDWYIEFKLYGFY